MKKQAKISDEEKLLDKKIKKERIFIIVLFVVLCFIVLYIFYILPNMRATLKKPILYLYPTENMAVSVAFAHPEYLKTTYPKYNGTWKVDVDEKGNITYNNRNYYALYWDEETKHKVNFTEGFYVEKDDAISFLEEKLAIIGLNERETNEFIMYWLPVLESNEKSLVYFELTEEREKYNKLIITPEPDSLLRVAIHIKKISKKVDIRKQDLTTFERKGFTAVEWGGIEY